MKCEIRKTQTDLPVRLAGITLKQDRHICAFFNSREEQDRVLMPLFKEGFDRGEKIFQIFYVPPDQFLAGLRQRNPNKERQSAEEKLSRKTDNQRA